MKPCSWTPHTAKSLRSLLAYVYHHNYTITNRQAPAFPTSLAVTWELLIDEDIRCTSASTWIFLMRLVLPCPKVAEIESHPLHACRNRRWDTIKVPALATKSGMLQTYKLFFDVLLGWERIYTYAMLSLQWCISKMSTSQPHWLPAYPLQLKVSASPVEITCVLPDHQILSNDLAVI